MREGIIAPIIPDADGMQQPFTRPERGFEIDEGLLKIFGKRFFRITERGLTCKVVRQKGLKTALKIKKRREKM